MAISKTQFYVACTLLFVQHSLCQQSSSYPPQGQTKLEDIERDNLKNAQSQSTLPQTSPQFAGQDQQLLYQFPAQQAGQQLQSVQQTPVTSSLFNVAGQQAYLGGGQQPFFYYPHTSQPTVDFASIFPGGYPFVQPAVGGTYAQTPATSAAKFGPPIASAPIRAATGPQISNPFFLPAAIQQPFYQPFAYGQPTSPQYYYNNALYQVQSPQKSLFSAGVKSTTPAAIKGKEESFVPIGAASSYYPAANPDPYAKYRLTTG